MSKTSRLLGVCVLTVMLLVGGAGGCASDRITAKSVRKDMSPEMQSVALMREQRKNVHARTKDTTYRQIWDDLDHIFLLDRPSRLSEYPVP